MKSISLIIGGLISITAMSLYLDSREDVSFQDAALFEGTVSHYASVDGLKIHCSDVEDMETCLNGFHQRNQEKAIVWLGNSQLHAVNAFKHGEKTVAALLHEKVRENALDLLTFSQPNANLQEHYVLFEYLKQKLPVDLLILPVVFDDTREDGLRNSLVDAALDPLVMQVLSQSDLGKKLLATTSGKSGDSDLAGVNDTVQYRVEEYLTGALRDSSLLWEGRPQMRGDIVLGLYKVRNWALNINPSSKRRKIAGRYQSNMMALDYILKSAAASSIKTLVYIVPLRGDVERPYVKSEYESFKTDVRNLAIAQGATFEDFEDVVDDQFWGQKQSTTMGGESLELDFMHFTSAGHAQLSTSLYGSLMKIYSSKDYDI